MKLLLLLLALAGLDATETDETTKKSCDTNSCNKGSFQSKLQWGRNKGECICKFCPPGKYGPKYGQVACLDCADGFYQNIYGKDKCHYCKWRGEGVDTGLDGYTPTPDKEACTNQWGFPRHMTRGVIRHMNRNVCPPQKGKVCLDSDGNKVPCQCECDCGKGGQGGGDYCGGVPRVHYKDSFERYSADKNNGGLYKFAFVDRLPARVCSERFMAAYPNPQWTAATCVEAGGTWIRHVSPGYMGHVRVCDEDYTTIGCFHSDSKLLGGDSNPIAVSKLKVGDMIMVFEQSNLTDPTLGVPTKAAILGWTRRPGAPGAGCLTILDFVEITYSCGTDCTGAMSVTQSHYIRVNAGANLKLAIDLSEGEDIEVWSADANSIVAGKITGLRRFKDNVTAVYSPITDKGTNFVAASGAVVPMAGETVIDGVVVNHNYVTMLHNLLSVIKKLVPAAFWDTAFAASGLFAAEPSILQECVETSAFINNVVRALRANNSEGLLLVNSGVYYDNQEGAYVNHTYPGNSAEVMQWAASNIFEIVGVEDTGAWSVQSAVTTTAGLALEAASQLAFKTTTGIAAKIDVSENTYSLAPTLSPTPAPTDASVSQSGGTGAAKKGQVPTIAPTPIPTNPTKPIFAETESALQAKIDASTVSESPLSQTASPTVAPTPHPTEKGHTAVVEKKEVPALKSKLKFAVSVAEGALAVMKQVVEGGVAASLGLKAEAVSVSGVTAASRRLDDGRQLQETCGSSIMALEIQSASGGAELTQLKNDLQLAATEGSVVTYVQAAAANKGVLTQCLKDQPKVLSMPVVEETVVVREVVVQQPTTQANPTSNNKILQLSKTDKILLGVLLPVGLLVVFALFTAFRKKKGQEKNEDQPVSFKAAEENLKGY